jgi:hypothetical protein
MRGREVDKDILCVCHAFQNDVYLDQMDGKGINSSASSSITTRTGISVSTVPMAYGLYSTSTP